MIYFDYINLIVMARCYNKMQEESRRSSLGLNKNRVKIMQQVLDKFVSKQFLTTHSLFHNLFSSQELNIDLSGDDFLKLIFGSQIKQSELYEFSYFHKREKKVLLYCFLLYFLTKTSKFELVLILNNEYVQIEELRQFLGEAWDSFTKRIIIYQHSRLNQFIFNLQWLAQLKRERQFLKGVIICDVNSFESNDKTSGQKYYKRIPKEFLVMSFKRDLYEYKIFQKSSLSYISDQQDLKEMNEKLAHYLHKKIDIFSFKCAIIVPLQYISACKTIEDSYKTVLIRAGKAQGFQEIIFTTLPFHIESSRQF